jgi:chromosome segregation ATPase
MERENNMAILNLKTKKTTFADLESKTLTKMVNFTKKKHDAQTAVSEFQDELNAVSHDIHTKELEYKETFETALLSEISVLTDKKASILRMMEVQRKAFGNADTKLEMTDADREDLKKTFAPHRKREADLAEKAEKQLAELEKTLAELYEARNEYHTNFYMPMFGLSQRATGQVYGDVHFLKDDQRLRNLSSDINTLSYHDAFPKGWV